MTLETQNSHIQPNVLHIVEPLNYNVGPCGLALLSISYKNIKPLNVLILGSTESQIMAEIAGIFTPDRINPPTGKSCYAITAFNRYLRNLPQVDIIHTWSVSALSLTSITVPHIPRVLTLTTGPDSYKQAHWLSMLIQIDNPSNPTTTTDNTIQTPPSCKSNITVLAVSNAVKKLWVQFGVPRDKIYVLRPGLEQSAINYTAREQLRREWGITSASSTTVIAAIASPACRLDAWRLTHILTLITLMKLDVKLIVPDNISRINLAYKMIKGVGIEEYFIVDDRINYPWLTMPACDIALIMGDDTRHPNIENNYNAARKGFIPVLSSLILSGLRNVPAYNYQPPVTSNEASAPMTGILPVMWAAAAGKIIIAEASYTVSEIFEHNHSCLLTKPGSNADLANLIYRVTGKSQNQITTKTTTTDNSNNNNNNSIEKLDPHKIWKLTDAARSDVFSLFSASRYLTDLQTVYNQIINNEKITIPEPAITGGLMFSGRV